MTIKYGVTNEAFKLALSESGIEAAKEVLDKKSFKTCSAKGDWAAFQVVLMADEDFSINLSKAPWFSKNGPILNARLKVDSPFQVKCYIEENVTDDDEIKKADILLEHDVAEVQGNVPAVVFCQVDVPRDAKPGIYKVGVQIYSNRMFEDEVLIGHIDVEIEVYNVELPAEKTFFLDLWQHTSNIARKHDVKLFSNEHFIVLEEYVKSLADLGQKSVTIIASEIPWRGQKCYWAENNKSNLFEYSMISVEKDIDGTYAYDYSAVEKYISICEKYGISDEIEVFGLVNVWNDPDYGFDRLAADYPDYIRIRYLDKADGCYRYINNGKDIDAYIRALAAFFTEKDLVDKVRIAADEPADIDMYRESLSRVKETAPGFKFKTAINHVEFVEEFQNDIFSYAPYIFCVSKEWDRLQGYMQKFKDKTFIWYVCCAPKHMNTFIKSNLVESRFIGILTSYMNFDGFLRWNYTVWPDNPRDDIRYGEFPAGDTNFVYPAYNGSVALSLRYKQLKRGIEDFELLKMLKENGRYDIAKAAMDLVIKEKDIRNYYPTDAYNFIPVERILSLDYEDFEKLKEIILKALSTF